MSKIGNKQISMVEISKMAGVSVATVSRVINKNGRYSPETEKRVKDLIKQYGYVPNMAAKGLKTKKSNFVGVFVPDITNEFFASVVLEIQNTLFKKGYLALLCNTNEDLTTEKEYLDMLSAAQIAGLIFVSGNTRIEQENLQLLPTVYIDRQPQHYDGSKHLVIESDNYGGGRIAANALYEAGCRRIACLHFSQSISTHRRRHDGYRDEMFAKNLEYDEALQFGVDEVSYEAAKRKMLCALKKGAMFDGIFCTTDWLALGTIAALEECGLKVPEDVNVVGFDDILPARLASKPLTTVRQQVNVMGRMAAKQLLRIADGEKLDTSRIEIAVSLVTRDTTNIRQPLPKAVIE